MGNLTKDNLVHGNTLSYGKAILLWRIISHIPGTVRLCPVPESHSLVVPMRSDTANNLVEVGLQALSEQRYLHCWKPRLEAATPAVASLPAEMEPNYQRGKAPQLT